MRRWAQKILQVRDHPEAQARGLATGFFFAVTPFWGLQLVLALTVSHLVRGNKVLAAAMTALNNPITALPLYGLCFFLGQVILGGSAEVPDFAAMRGMADLVRLGPALLLPLLTGTTLVGLAGAAAVYFLSGRILEALAARYGSPPDDGQPGKTQA
ncbi:MAG: DUF2062 domain-containing protein [Deltaproteobacteria bacterium]|nr:DUF2062 domain-containing protein [Deltaproteobacteria bacterium]